MSSRLPTSALSRSASSSMVASSSLVAASGSKATSSASRLVAQALIEASGVRRSWLTAASRALRSSLALGDGPRSGRLAVQPAAVRATATGRRSALSRCRSSAPGAPPRSTSWRRPTGRRRAWRRRVSRRPRCRPRPRGVQPPPPGPPASVRRTTAAPSRPKPSTMSSSRRRQRVVLAEQTRGHAGQRLRPRLGPGRRRCARRAARSTRALMTPATTRKTTSARGRAVADVKVWIGGVKNQLSKQECRDRGDEAGPDAADRRDRDHDEQIAQERVLQADGAAKLDSPTVISGSPATPAAKPTPPAARRQRGQSEPPGPRQAPGRRRTRRRQAARSRGRRCVARRSQDPVDHRSSDRARPSGDRRLAPSTSCVAFSARARPTSARGHVGAYDLVVRAAELLEQLACGARSRPPGARPRPSAGATWTPTSSALARIAIRAARRISWSPPGAPVSATTTRSLVSHGPAMPWRSR